MGEVIPPLCVRQFVQEHDAAANFWPLMRFFGQQHFRIEDAPGHRHPALRRFQQRDAALESKARQQMPQQFQPGRGRFASRSSSQTMKAEQAKHDRNQSQQNSSQPHEKSRVPIVYFGMSRSRLGHRNILNRWAWDILLRDSFRSCGSRDFNPAWGRWNSNRSDHGQISFRRPFDDHGPGFAKIHPARKHAPARQRPRKHRQHRQTGHGEKTQQVTRRRRPFFHARHHYSRHREHNDAFHARIQQNTQGVEAGHGCLSLRRASLIREDSRCNSSGGITACGSPR